jgi:hypothetical protein
MRPLRYATFTTPLFDQKSKMGIAKRIKKQTAKFDIKPDEIWIRHPSEPQLQL